MRLVGIPLGLVSNVEPKKAEQDKVEKPTQPKKTTQKTKKPTNKKK